MSEITRERMYDVLKCVEADMSAMRCDLSDMKFGSGALRGTTMAIQQDIRSIYGILRDHGTAPERIERRLDLREMAEAGARFDHHS